jgi:Na+-transporting methylmalonyl-CoA/oxaloacetate decarboxylase gamma subunit
MCQAIFLFILLIIFNSTLMADFIPRFQALDRVRGMKEEIAEEYKKYLKELQDGCGKTT